MSEENEISQDCEQEVLNRAVDFPVGIPGFSSLNKFIFTQQPEERPFAYMRSLNDENVAFAVVEAYHLLPDFSFEVDDKDLEVIGSPSPDNCGIFFIVKIEPQEGKHVKLTVNVNAPVIINIKEHKGRQVIIPSEDPSSKPEPFVFEL